MSLTFNPLTGKFDVISKEKIVKGSAQGQMSFWDDTLKKWTYSETSEMFWDDVNKRVGIGTATPSDVLHVQSAGGTTRIKIDTRNATPNGGMTIYSNTTFLGGFLASSTNCDFYSPAGNYGVIQMGFNNNISFARGDTGARVGLFRGDNNTWTFGSGTGTGSRVTIQGAGDSSITSALSVTNLSAGYLLFVRNDGNVGVGTSTPTAKLHLPAGTATASTAPIKLTAGTNLTTPEAGAIEFDGTNLYITQSDGTRKTIAFV